MKKFSVENFFKLHDYFGKTESKIIYFGFITEDFKTHQNKISYSEFLNVVVRVIHVLGSYVLLIIIHSTDCNIRLELTKCGHLLMSSLDLLEFD